MRLLDDSVRQVFQDVPKLDPDRLDPDVCTRVSFFTDGSWDGHAASWSFVVTADVEEVTHFVGFQSGRIALDEGTDKVFDSHGSAVCAEQHGLLWSAWWALRFWHNALLTCPILFGWDAQVAGNQANGLYGSASILGEVLRNVHAALEQLVERDALHYIHVPAHQGHVYNEIADLVAKEARSMTSSCPDGGRLCRLDQVLPRLRHLWLFFGKGKSTHMERIQEHQVRL